MGLGTSVSTRPWSPRTPASTSGTVSASRATRSTEFTKSSTRELSGGAQSELDYAVDDIVAEEEQRFVDFYNDAQPITPATPPTESPARYQGKKLRNTILDERKRKPFRSFDDIGVAGQRPPRPSEVLVERIIEELRDDDLKYRTFARREEEDE